MVRVTATAGMLVIRRTDKYMSFRFALTAAVFLLAASAGAAPENPALFRGEDPRLEQTINCKAEGTPVVELVGTLSESTGIVMNAGLDKDDWMVQDRKVIVHVTDMKLRDLMQEISTVLRFHWSRGGEQGKWTYRLWQDNQQRAEEESLRANQQDTQARQFREKRENALADMVNLGSLGSTDAAQLKSSDPWRYILATEPLGRDVAEFLNSFPEARDAFMSGREASFPVSQLSSALQDSVHRIAQSYDALTRSIGVSEDHSELLSDFDRLQITINRSSAVRDDVVSRSILGRITVESGASRFDIPIFEPASPVGKALGRAILHLRAGASRETVEKELQSDLQAAQQAAVAPESRRDISSDPALRLKVRLFDHPTIAPLPVTLAALAEKTKLNVVSDYFPGSPPTMASDEKTLGEHLEAIALGYGVNWVKAGRVIRLNDREWYTKRAWEVPEVWIRYWTARGKQNNGFQLIDLAQIGSLRDEQIDNTIMKNPTLVRLGAGDAARNREILRFYGMLSDEQRAQLSSQSLPVTSLGDDQWAALQKALATRGAAYAAAAKRSQLIRLTQSGQDVVEHKFLYYPGDDEPEVVFTLQTGVVYKTADEVPAPAPPRN